jgi:hypothetical protein
MSEIRVVVALPIMREARKMPRQYVINVVYTIVGAPFSSWVDKLVQERNKNLTSKNDLNIKLDPRIASAFAASTSVSCKLSLFSFLFVTFILLYLSFFKNPEAPVVC